MRMRQMLAVIGVVAGCSALLGGCELLDSAGAGGAQTPTMTYKQATLVQAPKTSALLSYFCPLGSAVCGAAFGPSPAKEDLRFDFELSFDVGNPNRFPIPTLSMLLATTLFPDVANVAELGAVCFKFCDPGDASCSSQGAEDACAANGQRDIDSLDDFAGAITDRLVDVATGNLDPSYGSNLGVRTIPAFGSTELKVVFTLGVDPMTNILGHIATDAASAWVQGQQAPLEIPYAVRGTLWVDVPLGLGRLGLPFGPESSSWQLAL